MKKNIIQFNQKRKLFARRIKQLQQMSGSCEDINQSGIAYVNSRGEEAFVSYLELDRKIHQYHDKVQKAGNKPKELVIIKIDDARNHYYASWNNAS